MKKIILFSILFNKLAAQDCKECFYVGSFTGNDYTFNIEPNEYCNRYLFLRLKDSSTINCNPLPIELNYFNAELINGNIILKWQTLTEINNSFFTILKSYDGYKWNELNNIKGAGNSNTIINYSYIDNDLNNSIIYYKLKQTDFNGDYKYYNIITIDNTNTNVNYRLYDLNGREVNKGFKGVKIKYYLK
jgi:hypothetical protein